MRHIFVYRNLTFGIAMTVGRLGAIVAPSYAYLVRISSDDRNNIGVFLRSSIF